MQIVRNFFYRAFILSLFILSLPIQVAISTSIIITSGFPFIYSQKRAGKDGKIFVLYKFRTMRKNAESDKNNLLKFNEADGPVFKIHNDPRFTKIGKLLSHTGLDELPQLFNVLKGDMALLGPRPLPVLEAKKLKSWQKKRHSIKPGVVSPWIVNGYHQQSFNTWMKSDIAYIEKKNLIYDSKLCIKVCTLMPKLIYREIISGRVRELFVPQSNRRFEGL